MCSHVGLAMRMIAFALASLSPGSESCRTPARSEHVQGYSLQEHRNWHKALPSRRAEMGGSLNALAVLLLRPAGPVSAWRAVGSGSRFAIINPKNNRAGLNADSCCEQAAGHAGRTRRSVLGVSVGLMAALGLQPFAPALAELIPTDELNPKALRLPPKVSSQDPAPDLNLSRSLDDEFTLEFDNTKPLGLNLRDIRVGTDGNILTSRVLVQDVIAGSQAAATGRIRADMIVVAVDGVNVEKETAKTVTGRIGRIKSEGRPVKVTFKDPEEFNDRLNMISSDMKKEEAMATVSTKIAPGGTNETEQIISVKRLEIPEQCKRNAQTGDIMEIRYTGRLEDGVVFDDMAALSRFDEDTYQFVLGKMPLGQVPKAFDVGMKGMCVGERRLIDVPPVLGFGAKGVPKRNIPPNARLFYDVELVSLNGLAMP